MFRIVHYLTLIIILIVASNCSSQNKQGGRKLVNRKPAVAGQFYPPGSAELTKLLSSLFSKAGPCTSQNVIAIMSPDAGYIYSGIVAATAFNQVDPEIAYNDIFIIASSHRSSYEGASIYTEGNYETPLGEVEVDITLAEKLIKDHEGLIFADTGAQKYEHSIEVQVPFLQYHMKKPFKIVPILIGSQSAATCRKLAGALKPYMKPGNLFVISSDFSHYPDYADAVEVDRATAHAIESNSEAALLGVLNDWKYKNVDQLLTNLCGWTSVLTLLNMTGDDPDVTVRTLLYQNSGDTGGDKDRVVGYCAIAFMQTGADKKVQEGYQLPEKDKRDLLAIARSTVESFVKNNKKPALDATQYSENLKVKSGAFVTLTKHGELRGCIGRFDPDAPLYQTVRDMAVSAASQDYRFSPVEENELKDISIEISVLTPLKKIRSIDEFDMGRHGIYIKKDGRSGTFLPQVARETKWTKEEFLGHCARDKAGIGWDGWKDAELYIYKRWYSAKKTLNKRDTV